MSDSPMYGPGGPSQDLPFELNPPGQSLPPEPDAVYCGGVTVMAIVVDVPIVGRVPGVMFRFSQVDGVMLQPIVFVGDVDQLGKLKPLVYAAVNAAITAAAS